MWHLFSFFEDRLWDCHSPNWQRDQLNACTFSTRGELRKLWPCNRHERRNGTGGARRSDDLQDVGTPRSVLSGDSWNLSLETWKNLILRSFWQWIMYKMLLSMNVIERERDWQDEASISQELIRFMIGHLSSLELETPTAWRASFLLRKGDGLVEKRPCFVTVKKVGIVHLLTWKQSTLQSCLSLNLSLS